jgi:putative transposase
MKRSKFTEEQITYALRQAEAGTPATQVCRELGMTEQTFYRWRRKYAGMGVAELRRLRQLEEENRQLKPRVADLALDKHMLQEVIRKKLSSRLSNGLWYSLCGSASRSVHGGLAG